MRAIIVDDEALAIHSMEKVLNELGGVEIVGKFQDPRLVIEAVTHNMPDVLFLDIEMPMMNGMRLAEQLLEIRPSLNIVFVTAYSEYAVMAFDLVAKDYIVKPIRHDRVSRTLLRIKESLAIDNKKDFNGPGMIRLFRTLEIEYPGQEPQLIPWRTNKAQELFAYLLYRSGKLVRKEVLNEILWPNLTKTKAFSHLYTTIYQLRKTLSSLHLEIRIINGNDGYLLEKGEFRVDTIQWENSILSTTEVSKDTIEDLRRVMQLYRGSFLQEYDYTWAIHERERLSMLWAQHAVRIADYLMDTEQYAETISLCHEIRGHQPYIGYSYFMLMKIHDALGDRAGVREQYQRLNELMREELGEQPEPYIIEWYNNWVNQL